MIAIFLILLVSIILILVSERIENDDALAAKRQTNEKRRIIGPALRLVYGSVLTTASSWAMQLVMRSATQLVRSSAMRWVTQSVNQQATRSAKLSVTRSARL